MGMRLGVPALAGALLFSSVAATAARADPIDDKRKQAAAIADQIDKLRTDAEVLAEHYNATVEHLHQLDAQRQTALDALAKATDAAAATRLQIKEWALRTYVFSGTGASGDPFLTLLESKPGTAEPNQLWLRRGLTDIAVGKDQSLVDTYRRTSDDARRAKAEVDAAQAGQQALQAQLVTDRANVEKATAAQTDLLAKTQGDLEAMIVAEQARRAAEEERKVKERLAAEAAQKAAAAEATRKAEEARRATSTTATTAAATTPKPASSTSAQPPARPATTAVAPPPSSGPPAVAPSVTTARPTSTTVPPTSTTSPPPAPAVRASAAVAVAAAMSQLGVRYQWGGDSPATGFDCSGLMYWAWAQAGRTLPHNAAEQYATLPKVPIGELQPGDLVFFGRDLHHDGMYIGNGQMVHSPFTGDVVRIATIYRADLVIFGARP